MALRVLLISLYLAGGVPTLSQPGVRVDKSVQPTSWGRVRGQVYDASNSAPLAGARVVIRSDGAFAETGKTVAITDAMGRYVAQALLGRMSQNFDLGRALNSGLIGVLAGGAMNRTKRIDVNRLEMMVTAPGYKPFVGICPCRSLDAEQFAVIMEPIVLVREGATEASAAASGWGVVQLADAAVEPAIARPGKEILLRASVRVPQGAARDLEVVCVSETWRSKRLAMTAQDDAGLAVFTARVTAPKVKSSLAVPVTFVLGKSPLDVLDAGPIKRLVQVVLSDEELPVAEKRLRAFEVGQAGDGASSLSLWTEICADPRATEQDYLYLADAAEARQDYATAAAALQRALALAGDRQPTELVARHAEALVRSGEAPQVVASYGSMVAEAKSRDPRKRPSPSLLVAIGESYLSLGDLAGAARVREALDSLPTTSPGAMRFRSSLRVAETAAAVSAEPNNPVREVDYGRALLDVGRYEEAVAVLRHALERDPDLTSVRSDLDYAAQQLLGREEANSSDGDADLEAARQRVMVGEGKDRRKSRDFEAWHALAILLYKRWDRLQERGDAGAQQALRECLDALTDALKCARSGARVDEGLYAPYAGFVTSRTVAIAGYAYDRAASDFALFQGLLALSARPDDTFGWFGLGSALAELGEAEYAGRALERARRTWGGSPQFGYVEAVVAEQEGETDKAIRLLREVTKLNPRHAEAHLRLAALLTDGGDAVGAAAALAAYAEYFGTRMGTTVGEGEAR